MKYVIITPAYNEENYIGKTIQSVIKQSVLPSEWIIVDDGSTDRTAQIVAEQTKDIDWIRLEKKQKSAAAFGANVIENFYYGFDRLDSKDWNFIVKLDADIEIDKNNFFEFQLKKFDEIPKLGISSGITYSIHNGEKILTKGRPYWRTGGAMKVYRRKCFEEIGGLAPIYGWDGLDEYKAMYRGWKTRTFFDLRVNHLGKKRALNREKQIWLANAKGKSLYQRGYPIEFVLLKGIQYFKISFQHAKAFYKGYFSAKKNGLEQFVDSDEKIFIRRFQYRRLLNNY